MFFLEDLSVPKVLAVLVIALLLFGPKKLPELGSSPGTRDSWVQARSRRRRKPVF